MHTPNNKAKQYVKQKLIELKGEIDKHTGVGDFNTLLLIIDRTTRQKISNNIELNNTIKQQNLINIYRTLYPTT